MTTFYVSSYPIHRGKRWTWGIGTTPNRELAFQDAAAMPQVVVYEVDAPTRGEAAAIVFRWLSQGMPMSMRQVAKVWPQHTVQVPQP